MEAATDQSANSNKHPSSSNDNLWEDILDHRHHLPPKAWAQSTNPSSNSCISAYCNYQVGHNGTEIEWRDGEESMTMYILMSFIVTKKNQHDKEQRGGGGDKI
jgi:hypothetical protein